jgi:hypothetical protein
MTLYRYSYCPRTHLEMKAFAELIKDDSTLLNDARVEVCGKSIAVRDIVFYPLVLWNKVFRA